LTADMTWGWHPAAPCHTDCQQ